MSETNQQEKEVLTRLAAWDALREDRETGIFFCGKDRIDREIADALLSKGLIKIGNRGRLSDFFELTEEGARTNAGDMPFAPLKEKEEAGIPEEVPKMSFELAGMSDVAAIEYGTNLPLDHLDIASELTDAHLAGQSWMYRKLMEGNTEGYWFQKAREVLVERNDFKGQLSSITFDKENLRTRVDDAEKGNRQLVSKLANAQRERDAALKEVGEWTDATETFPEQHTWVMVWVPSRSMAFMANRADRGWGEKWESEFEEIHEGISHWKPLPKAPAKYKKEEHQ